VAAGGCQRFGEARHPGPRDGPRPEAVRLVSANLTAFSNVQFVDQLPCDVLCLQECRVQPAVVLAWAQRMGRQAVVAGPPAAGVLAAIAVHGGALRLVASRAGAQHAVVAAEWRVGSATWWLFNAYIAPGCLGAAAADLEFVMDAWLCEGAAVSGALAAVCGDFNAELTTVAVQPLLGALGFQQHVGGPTTTAGRQAIDWAVLSSAASSRVLSSELLWGTGLRTHAVV